MWEISISDQIFTSLYSICLGVILCVCYDILRSFRRATNSGTVAIFLGDILYFTVSAFVVFIFLLARTNGEIRGYVLLCTLLGFVIFRVTISRFVVMIITFFMSLIVRGLRIASYYILKFLFSVGEYFIKFLKFSQKKCIRALKTLKKLLKSIRQLLYTKQNKRNMGE